VSATRTSLFALAAVGTLLLAACTPSPQEASPPPADSSPPTSAPSQSLPLAALGPELPSIQTDARLSPWDDRSTAAVVLEETKPPIPTLATRRDSSGGLVMSLGRGLYSGKHAKQSIELHLAPILPLADVPLARRLDLRALESASSNALSPASLADQLTLRTNKDEVQRMRTALSTDPLPEFTALLGTSVFADRALLTTATSEVSRASQWRQSALAWIVTTIRMDQVERYVAFNMTPYVVSHVGIQDPSQAEAPSYMRADAIALARVHHATQMYSDARLYELILALSQPDVVLAFGLAARGFYNQSTAFLNHFHTEFVASISPRQ